MTVVSIYVKKRLCRNQVSNKLESDVALHLRVSQSRLCKLDNLSHYASELSYASRPNSIKDGERSGENLQDITEGIINVSKLVEIGMCMTNKSAIDMLMESIEGVYKRLEEMKNMNTALFDEIRKTSERNEARYKETERHVEKTHKEMDRTVTTQLRGIRRRLEIVEKKSSSDNLN